MHVMQNYHHFKLLNSLNALNYAVANRFYHKSGLLKLKDLSINIL